MKPSDASRMLVLNTIDWWGLFLAMLSCAAVVGVVMVPFGETLPEDINLPAIGPMPTVVAILLAGFAAIPGFSINRRICILPDGAVEIRTRRFYVPFRRCFAANEHFGFYLRRGLITDGEGPGEHGAWLSFIHPDGTEEILHRSTNPTAVHDLVRDIEAGTSLTVSRQPWGGRKV